MITYRGIDKRGLARTGKGEIAPSEFAEACYVLGWRDVVISDEQGTHIGGVGVRDGRRYWWAEDVPHSGDKST